MIKDLKIFNCHDCNFNTLGFNPTFKPEEFQFYMLQDDIWNIVSNNSRIKILCIPCVETHLGRKLNSEDYKITPIEMLKRYIVYLKG